MIDGSTSSRPCSAGRLRRRVAAVVCAGLLTTANLTQVAAAPNYTPSVTSSATVPSSVVPGGSASISSNFTSTAALSNVNLDVEVRDSSNTKIYQRLFPGQAFAAGQSQTYTATWAVPAAQALGTYTIALGAFSSDYQVGYGWTDNAAQVSVQSQVKPSFTTTASVSPSSVAPGSSATITTNLTSATAVSSMNLDVEVRDSSNNKIYQQLFPNQVFSAGQSRAFTATWAVPAAQAGGTYSVAVGAYSPDYGTTYGWSDNAALVLVAGSTGNKGVTGTSYYVDCNSGNDGYVGTDTAHAWATVSRANQAALKPGDGLLLKRGCAWTGPLSATWSGTASQPIMIEAYGSGNLPLIQNGNPYQIRVTGSYLTFDSLSVRSDPDSYDSNCKSNRIGYREGFYFFPGSAYNVVQNSFISDLGGGLEISAGSHNNSVEGNEFAHNNMMYSADQYANDGGATALVMFGDNNDIGYNNIHDTVACSNRYGNGVIGHVFDIENGINNVYHHNHAVNNGSNFAELGSYTASNMATNTTFAYNVVINNGITSHPNSKGTKIYNNTFSFVGNGILTCQSCSTASMILRNNIFYASTGIYADGPLDESNNLYFNPLGTGMYNTQPLSSTSVLTDPQFANAAAYDFHIQTNSPAVNAGSMDSSNAGYKTDFDGKPSTRNGMVDIGAYEQH